jgi:fused signal recognition particle receptor
MGLFDLFKRKKADSAGTEDTEARAPDPAAEKSPVEAVPEPPGIQSEPADKPTPDALRTSEPHPATPRQGRLRQALNRTRAYLATAFTADVTALAGEEFYDELLDSFVASDVGSELARELVASIRSQMAARGLVRRSEAGPVVRDVIAAVFDGVREPAPLEPGKLAVLMMVGVNGSGKTTQTAKLASRLKADGFNVLLAAADTFRAAAIDQLKLWAERIGVDIVAGQAGADSASVVFDAAQAALSRGTEVLIVDTAGRLQTKSNLMAELAKVARTAEKATADDAGASVAYILVLDATVGQNAVSQAELFNEACPLSGFILTKLDGTARGGAILQVVRTFKLPVLYVGIGESLDDLLEFDPREFAAGFVPD